MIGFGAMDCTISAVSAPLTERPKNDVGAVHGVFQRARVGLDRMGGFPLVHALGAALVDDALGVAEQDVLGREAHRLDELEAGDAGGARAVADELRLLDVAAGELQWR